jgi:hypothetical protein
MVSLENYQEDVRENRKLLEKWRELLKSIRSQGLSFASKWPWLKWQKARVDKDECENVAKAVAEIVRDLEYDAEKYTNRALTGGSDRDYGQLTFADKRNSAKRNECIIETKKMNFGLGGVGKWRQKEENPGGNEETGEVKTGGGGGGSGSGDSGNDGGGGENSDSKKIILEQTGSEFGNNLEKGSPSGHGHGLNRSSASDSEDWEVDSNTSDQQNNGSKSESSQKSASYSNKPKANG